MVRVQHHSELWAVHSASYGSREIEANLRLISCVHDDLITMSMYHLQKLKRSVFEVHMDATFPATVRTAAQDQGDGADDETCPNGDARMEQARKEVVRLGPACLLPFTHEDKEGEPVIPVGTIDVTELIGTKEWKERIDAVATWKGWSEEEAWSHSCKQEVFVSNILDEFTRLREWVSGESAKELLAKLGRGRRAQECKARESVRDALALAAEEAAPRGSREEVSGVWMYVWHLLK